MAENENPEVPLGQTPVTKGETTSEYKMSRGVQVVGNIMSLIGTIGVVASPYIESNQDQKWAIVVSAVLAIVGQVSKMLVALGYNQGRASVKSSPYTK